MRFDLRRAIFLSLGLVGCLFAQPRLEIQCDDYKHAICGNNPTCLDNTSASKCEIKNTDILGAFRNDLAYTLEMIARTNGDSFHNGYMLDIFHKAYLEDLPSIGETKTIEQKADDNYIFYLKMERIDKDTLKVIYNDDFPSNKPTSITYKQMGKNVESIMYFDMTQEW